MKKKIKIGKIFGLIFAVLFVAIVVFPFYWQIISSFKDPADISMMPTEIWPSSFSWISLKMFSRSPFSDVFEKQYYCIRIFDGDFYCGGIAGSLCFYQNSVFGINLAEFYCLANMFPIIAVVTPMFVIFRNMGIINTYAGLIIPSVIITLPQAIWTLIAFIKTLPYDLEEAAQIDGCNRFMSVIKVILPLAAPGVFTTAILAFITAWNEFMFALILVTRDSMRTVPVAISLFPGQFTVPWGDMAAASVVATVPIVIVVLICQKRIVSGLTAGAVKG